MPTPDEVREVVDLLVQQTRALNDGIEHITFHLSDDGFLCPVNAWRPGELLGPSTTAFMPEFHEFDQHNDKSYRDWAAMVRSYARNYLTVETSDVWLRRIPEVEYDFDDPEAPWFPDDEEIPRTFQLRVMTDEEVDVEMEFSRRLNAPEWDPAWGEDGEAEAEPEAWTDAAPATKRGWWARLTGR